MATKEKRKTEMTTGVVRLSYPYIWEPRPAEDGKKPGDEDSGGAGKYSASLIIPKKDKKTLKLIEEVTKLAIEAGNAGGFKGKKGKYGSIKVPLTDGDEAKPDNEEYANAYYLTASSKSKPGIVDRNAKPILDRGKVYAGCYVLAIINFYPFNFKGKIGIACSLEHIMKVKDGEEFTSRMTAEEAFADVDVDDLPDEDFDSEDDNGGF